MSATKIAVPKIAVLKSAAAARAAVAAQATAAADEPAPEELAAVHAAFCASTATRLDTQRFGRILPLAEDFDAEAERLAKLIEAEEYASARKGALFNGALFNGAAPIFARGEVAPPQFVPSAGLLALEPLLELGDDTAVPAAAALGSECLPLGISLEHLFAAYNAVAVSRLARKWAAAAPPNLRASGPRELWPKMLECFLPDEIFSLLLWGLVVAKKIGRGSSFKPQYRAAICGYLLVRDGTDLFAYGALTIQILCNEVAECISSSECYRELCMAYRRVAA